MEPTGIASLLAKPAATRLLAYFRERAAKNDEQLKRDREELAIEWGAELKAALPQVVSYLDARVDELDSRLAKVFEDPQFGRIFTNFTFEAAREAIDERRKMLAHAAVGIVDPDIAIERKARVERTLRVLDPTDVLVLHGLTQVPGYLGVKESAAARMKFVKTQPSMDVLLSAGCLRLDINGGGFGVGASAGISLTQLGEDILLSLRTYVASRNPPFPVPWREVLPGERTEEQAREITRGIEGLEGFVRWSARRTAGVDLRLYKRDLKSQPRAGTLSLYLHKWETWKAELDRIGQACPSGVLRVVSAPQPFTPSEGAPYDLLRVELSGHHDILRYLADDCEALWV
jgi:hypothetical protein